MNSSPQFDPIQFWKEHDRALPTHGSSNRALLSHDLYRGMPSWFNAYFASFQKRAFLELVKSSSISRPALSLDLGCGTGRWVGTMLEMGWSPIGVDIGLNAIQYASRHWDGAGFAVMALPDICFGRDCFDAAVSVTVLQHLPREAQILALRAIYQVLKPGGTLFICESIAKDEPSQHVFSNSFLNWVKIYRDIGFQIHSVRGTEFLPFIKTFQMARDLLPSNHGENHTKGANSRPGVSEVAGLLERNLVINSLVHFLILLAYPFELLCSRVFPVTWARQAFFALRKPE